MLAKHITFDAFKKNKKFTSHQIITALLNIFQANKWVQNIKK